MVQCVYWAILLVLGCGEFTSHVHAQIKYMKKLQRSLLVSGAGEPLISDLKSHAMQVFFSDRLNVSFFMMPYFWLLIRINNGWFINICLTSGQQRSILIPLPCKGYHTATVEYDLKKN